MGTDLMQDTIFVGMYVHKAAISVAVADVARGRGVRRLGNFPNRADPWASLSTFARRAASDSAVTKPARAAMGCIGKSKILAMNARS
jgi:hypothetical protein